MKTNKKENIGLRFLYHTVGGRFLLKILTNRWVSQVGGFLLSTHFSKLFIKRFARKNHIVMDDYYCDNLKSFNDFFSRKVRPTARPISEEQTHFISPSDGFISFYPIKDDLVLPVKQSHYTISSLLKNEKLAKKYQDGICLVIRLCVDHYHRYCYLDDGKKEKNIFIPGRLHTVRPIALASFPVFTENAREYTVMHTVNFGDVVQIEVGALFVGKINNFHEEHSFSKGEEKGTFLFGGSTIILLVEKDRVKFPKEYFMKTEQGEEISIKMGEKIGENFKKDSINISSKKNNKR